MPVGLKISGSLGRRETGLTVEARYSKLTTSNSTGLWSIQGSAVKLL
jgi:hypothetical protein